MTVNPLQLSGFAFPGGNEDPFGMWDVAATTSGVSFGAGAAAVAPEEPLYRVSFASPEEGTAVLGLRQRELQGQQATLLTLEQRLTQIAQAGGGVSFAASGESAPEFARAELATKLIGMLGGK